jgi:hypothetical protein
MRCLKRSVEMQVFIYMILLVTTSSYTVCASNAILKCADPTHYAKTHVHMYIISRGNYHR